MCSSDLQQRVEELGGDGRLLWSNDTVHLVTLAEKLLIPALSKIANFVPGGGIWMNTQRPEWNDANNALVGNGLSVVTLFYLRRYFEHLRSLVPQNEELQLSAEVATWLQATTSALSDEIVTPDATDEEAHRFRLMSALGVAFSTYREQVVGRGFSGTTKISGAEIAQLCNLACVHLDATISRSRRSDGLFHSYNILHVDIGRQSASIQFLSEMLEGQVAALASGVLEPQDAISLVSTMFDSDLYRPDISNFILYPARQPKSFLSKNIISTARVAQNAFLVRCVETGDKTIVTRDIAGNYRFAANLASIADLDQALSSYSADAQVADLANTCRDQTLALFEHVYEHHSYTGRSSSMHAFEGIGSVYWHMVAKLLVALQKLMSEGSDDSTGRRHNEMLAELYWRVRTGMGPKKSAASWGAIPTDPYSHSPAHAGAQQPGMTGFAKEEVLARPFELGLSVEGGLIHLNTALLRRDEFISAPGAVEFRHLDGNLELVPLPPKSLLFSYCQVPVVVTLGDQPMTTVTFADGSVLSGEGSSLDTHTSGQIFARSGSVRRVEFTTVG